MRKSPYVHATNVFSSRRDHVGGGILQLDHMVGYLRFYVPVGRLLGGFL